MPRREEEDDLLAEAKRAMRMKVQMDLLRGMGILREEVKRGAREEVGRLVGERLRAALAAEEPRRA
jgi:hypothetical protein